ncbi:hypothetical protein DFH28DRAFT_1104554 [Melampsora americana]|nr:hypothetical protein DFH28DRAFT_1104554 [Melampsora americana]
MSDLAPINFVFTYEERHILTRKPSCLEIAEKEIKELFELSLDVDVINVYACLPHLGCDHRSLLAEVTASSWAGLGPNTHLIIMKSSNLTSSTSCLNQLNSSSRPISRSASSDGHTVFIREEVTYKTNDEEVTQTQSQKVPRDEQFPHGNVNQPQHKASSDPHPNKLSHLPSFKTLPAHPRSFLDRRQRLNSKLNEAKLPLPSKSHPGRVPLSPLSINTALVDVFVGRTPDPSSSPSSELVDERSVQSEVDKEDEDLYQGGQMEDQIAQQSQFQPGKWENLQLMLDSLLGISPTSESYTPFLPPLSTISLFKQQEEDAGDQEDNDNGNHERSPHHNNCLTAQTATDDITPVKPMDQLQPPSQSINIGHSAEEVLEISSESPTRRLAITPVSASELSSSTHYFTLATPAQGPSFESSHLTSSPTPSISSLPLVISTPHSTVLEVILPCESHVSASTYDVGNQVPSPQVTPQDFPESVEDFFGLNLTFDIEDKKESAEEKPIHQKTERRPKFTMETEVENYLEPWGSPKFGEKEGFKAAKKALMKLPKESRTKNQTSPQTNLASYRGLIIESKTSEDRVPEDIQDKHEDKLLKEEAQIHRNVGSESVLSTSSTKESSVMATPPEGPFTIADVFECGSSPRNIDIETIQGKPSEELEPQVKFADTSSQKQLLRLLLIPKGQIQVFVFSTNNTSPAPKFTVTIDQSRSVIDLLAYISSQPEFTDESENNSLWLQDPDGDTEKEISKQGTIKEAKLQTGDRLRFGTRAKYTSTRRKTRMSVISKMFKDQDERISPITAQLGVEPTKNSVVRPSVALRKRGTLNAGSLTRRSGLPESPARPGSSRIPPGSVKPFPKSLIN